MGYRRWGLGQAQPVRPEHRCWTCDRLHPSHKALDRHARAANHPAHDPRRGRRRDEPISV